MSTPPWALVRPIESSTARYSLAKVSVSVIRVESPAFVELVAAPRTSLFPSHTVTNVGSTFIIICVWVRVPRSEEHTSELQSQSNLVCRLLLEKKKTCNHCCGAAISQSTLRP